MRSCHTNHSTFVSLEAEETCGSALGSGRPCTTRQAPGTREVGARPEGSSFGPGGAPAGRKERAFVTGPLSCSQGARTGLNLAPTLRTLTGSQPLGTIHFRADPWGPQSRTARRMSGELPARAPRWPDHQSLPGRCCVAPGADGRTHGM